MKLILCERCGMVITGGKKHVVLKENIEITFKWFGPQQDVCLPCMVEVILGKTGKGGEVSTVRNY